MGSAQCDIVTSDALLAYRCPAYFKIFDVSDLKTPSLVYETEKPVQQVKASNLATDSFISFIEAATDTLSNYENLKVVDVFGERDLGLTNQQPSMSIYLGDGIVL